MRDGVHTYEIIEVVNGINCLGITVELWDGINIRKIGQQRQ